MSITELANSPPVSLSPKPMASRGVMYAGMLLGSVALMLTVGALHDSAYGEGGRPAIPVSAGQGRSAPEAVRPVAASAAPAVSAAPTPAPVAAREPVVTQLPVAERAPAPAPVVAQAPVEVATPVLAVEPTPVQSAPVQSAPVQSAPSSRKHRQVMRSRRSWTGCRL